MGRRLIQVFITEERSRIAREIRLQARKDKKKVKADAKRARKQNDILHRRAVSLRSYEKVEFV